jgi:hypothetical protein
MDYIAPLNTTPTEADPRPAYFDGNAQTGQEGSYPSGRSIEYPMREILAVIENAALAPSNGDLTQLLQAINALIAQAIAAAGGGGGGGTPADFTLMPIYPHITVGSGIMSFTAGAGSVAVPDGQTFIHRGGKLYNSTDTASAARTFTTAANKTYHLRWRYNAGAPAFGLYDLADAGYNPTSAAETIAAFDSAYDDMLIARVVTNGANVPTVTALKNLHHLAFSGVLAGTDGQSLGASGANFLVQNTLNWARSPDRIAFHRLKMEIDPDNAGDYNVHDAALGRTSPNQQPTSMPLTRYGINAVVTNDRAIAVKMLLSCGA